MNWNPLLPKRLPQVNIYDNHPGVPVDNVIEDNRYCHHRSLNSSSTRGFIGEHGQTVAFLAALYASHGSALRARSERLHRAVLAEHDEQ